MILEYILVSYKGEKAVLADGTMAGVTNNIFLLPTGDYTISLDTAATTPVSVDVSLNGTTLMRPQVVVFI